MKFYCFKVNGLKYAIVTAQCYEIAKELVKIQFNTTDVKFVRTY